MTALWTALWTFALSNPWRSAAIGLALIFAIGLGAHKVIVADWKSDLADVKEKYATCKTNLTTVTTALDRQNEAVRGFQVDAIAKQAEDERRATEARERASRDRRREAADDRSGHEFMNAWFEGQFQ